jgi:hypothetical protein
MLPCLRRSLVALSALLGLEGALQANENQAKLPDPMVTLLDCRKITDGMERLACFDTYSRVLASKIAASEVIVTDRAAVRATRRKLFGFSLPNLGLFPGDDGKEEVPDQINTAVESAWISGNRLRIRFADGSTWQQIGTDQPRRFPAKGMVAVIKRASMGTYFVRLGDQIGFRMVRVE